MRRFSSSAGIGSGIGKPAYVRGKHPSKYFPAKTRTTPQNLL
jgi:hypothetical protein